MTEKEKPHDMGQPVSDPTKGADTDIDSIRYPRYHLDTMDRLLLVLEEEVMKKKTIPPNSTRHMRKSEIDQLITNKEDEQNWFREESQRSQATWSAMTAAYALIDRISVDECWGLARMLATMLGRKLVAGARVSRNERENMGERTWEQLKATLAERDLAITEEGTSLTVKHKPKSPTPVR